MSLSDDPVESVTPRKTKIRYTRDFLLSLSESDVCKKLPAGFDRAILSEFEDASQDKHRVSGGFPSHGSRRAEHGSSPPTRGEAGNYSRGRWDSRSSGRSDKDSDTHLDLDSDSGRRFGNHRRPWQAPEHDGLLGSGSFPRPPGYATGSSVHKFRANEQYHLNKSSEPYHPPRPYKAVPHSRRETNDSFNDETFGSLECTSEDRAEEERKRRASFELMRREQVKAIQENQKLNPDKRKIDFDITTLMEDTSDEKRLINKSSESDQPVTLPVSSSNSSKPACPSLGPTSRPLVPPGFKSTALEKNVGTKTQSHRDAAEENKQMGETLVVREQREETASDLVSTDSHSYMTSHLPDANKAEETTNILELGAHKSTSKTTVGNSNQDNRASILEKLFNGALNDGSSGADEHHGSKVDEIWSPHTTKSSKFAQWFEEDVYADQIPVEDLSSGKRNDLLSLITGGEKGNSMTSDKIATDPRSVGLPFHSPELPDRHMTAIVTASIAGNSEQPYGGNKPDNISSVLTCEDLEQKILLEACDKGPNSLPPVQGRSVRENTGSQKAAVDDQASQHLLSLLQKGTNQTDMAPLFNLDARPSGSLHNIEGGVNTSSLNNLRKENAETNSKTGDSLTLETLFGTAFMRELQSVKAPVSVQRGSSGPPRVDVTGPDEFAVTEKGIVPHMQDTNTSQGSSLSVSNLIEKMKSVGTEEQSLGFNNPQMILDSLQLQNSLVSKPGVPDESGEVPLSEEDSLFTLGDPVNLRSLTSGNTSVNIVEKLASLNSAIRDERSIFGGRDDAPFRQGSFDRSQSDIPHNPHIQPSQQFHSTELNHGRPMFHSLPSHPSNMTPQMKFMSPEGVIRHNSSPSQLTMDMLRPPFHHPGSGATAFDPPPHHPMLPQMQMPGNFPPHVLQGIPPGAPLPPHPNNQVTGFMPELNPVHGFPLGHQRPNFDGSAVAMPAPDQLGGGNNHPEAFQRLIEMELRSNPKQIHPFAAPGHGQGMYGPQLDMRFGYR